MMKVFARNRHTVQRLGYGFITLMALVTVLPIVGTVIFILFKGGSAISWEFITGFPHDGMRAGGIHTATTEMVIFEWLHRAGTDDFRALLPLLR